MLYKSFSSQYEEEIWEETRQLFTSAPDNDLSIRLFLPIDITQGPDFKSGLIKCITMIDGGADH